jgi:hypothetical protein
MTKDFPVLFSYSRAQAISDGVLHDVTHMAKEAGFRYPVAITAVAWADCVAWPSSGDGSGQSEKGRLWDVLTMARVAVNRAAGDTVELTVLVVPLRGASRRPQLMRLKMVVGPGDDMEPVITIMLPSED